MPKRLFSFLLWCGGLFPLLLFAQTPPNVILIVADDLGYGDVGFNGNEVIQTPHLDQMAAGGVVMDRFYAAAPLCSPTRGSILTGRHPFRFGILAAHTGGMRPGELTLAEAFKEADYATGFFGKWHLGWVRPEAEWDVKGHYSPPWRHGFDLAFATKSAVPTWNPTKTPEGWTAWGYDGSENWAASQYVLNGELVTDNLDGDDSRVIMDRAIPFMEQAQQSGQPFFSCIWFHTPHEPVVAGPEYLAMYPELSERQQHYYGAITAMDEQIGRLRDQLEAWGIEKETVILFTSDNGPARPQVRRGVASAGPYRGGKHTVYEGGLRVPTVVAWPGQVEAGRSAYMSGTVDIFSTLLALAGVTPKLDDRPMDGLDLSPAILEGASRRPTDLGAGWMRLYKDTQALTWIDNQYKLISRPLDEEIELYDLLADPSESVNLAAEQPERVAAMQAKLKAWLASCPLSRDGMDYAH
jgi:arylsulfatase A-like enzyme